MLSWYRTSRPRTHYSKDIYRPDLVWEKIWSLTKWSSNENITEFIFYNFKGFTVSCGWKNYGKLVHYKSIIMCIIMDEFLFIIIKLIFVEGF